jgi:hypothetical protein
MRWVLRLIATGDDAGCLSTDLVEICRPGGLSDIANLGLTLPEAKQLLVGVQRAIVAGQVDSHGQLRPYCPGRVVSLGTRLVQHIHGHHVRVKIGNNPA